MKTRLSASTRSPPATRTASHATLSDFGVVTVDEVTKVIKLLPPKSSPLDPLPVSLLKASVYAMAPLLARLANLSFTTGIFPSQYKLEHVVQILKKPTLNKSNPANYRPVTNLCTSSKVLEKLALARLRPHVMSSVNFNRFQPLLVHKKERTGRYFVSTGWDSRVYCSSSGGAVHIDPVILLKQHF